MLLKYTLTSGLVKTLKQLFPMSTKLTKLKY